MASSDCQSEPPSEGSGAAPLSRTFVLLHRALAGDREAERLLYTDLLAVLQRAWGNHRLASRLDASVGGDDLVNQALLRVLEKGPGLGESVRPEPGSLRGLLVHVLDGVIVDCYRSQQAQKNRKHGAQLPSTAHGPSSTSISNVASQEGTPSRIVGLREIDALLVGQLADDRDREIWRLYRERGLQPREIAAHLRCSPQAVHRRLGRIRRRLSHWVDLRRLK